MRFGLDREHSVSEEQRENAGEEWRLLGDILVDEDAIPRALRHLSTVSCLSRRAWTLTTLSLNLHFFVSFLLETKLNLLCVSSASSFAKIGVK